MVLLMSMFLIYLLLLGLSSRQFSMLHPKHSTVIEISMIKHVSGHGTKRVGL